MDVTSIPQEFSNVPNELAITPFPTPLITPPVTKIYFIFATVCTNLLICIRKICHRCSTPWMRLRIFSAKPNLQNKIVSFYILNFVFPLISCWPIEPWNLWKSLNFSLFFSRNSHPGCVRKEFIRVYLSNFYFISTTVFLLVCFLFSEMCLISLVFSWFFNFFTK